MTKKNNTKKNIVILFFIIVITALITVIINYKNDGMNNRGILNVYYRTYSIKNGWTKFTKNGLTSGDNNSDIENININTKVSNGEVVYDVYGKDGKWKTISEDEKNVKNEKISGIRLALYDELYLKYNICYRTYNSKYKWMDWSCNNEINGAKDIYIKKIQIKIIPKDVIKSEYLKDYTSSSKNSSIGF